MSTSDSHSLGGYGTKSTTVKWPIHDYDHYNYSGALAREAEHHG